jgi:D-glycero-alpha-D-manno-heptose-7-phosphate kinase
MILVRSPLRVSLGGGGTDLCSYYSKYEGFLVAAAIDKYVYISVNRTFVPDLLVKYSELERVKNAANLVHPIIRESLSEMGLNGTYMEIVSMADIPGGTGLGSSGSFTTALLKALHAYKRHLIHPEKLAEAACHIEIERLHEPIGKQDQYISAFGGLTCFKFQKNGKVEAEPLHINEETLFSLEDNLLLFFTGYSRSASSILKEQDQKSKQQDQSMIDNLHYVKEMGYLSKECLEDGDLRGFAEILHKHWHHKKERSQGMSNPEIDKWYELAMQNGALGGKLIGAGGGGFLMFYSEEKSQLRKVLGRSGLKEVRFRFDLEGTKLITNM